MSNAHTHCVSCASDHLHKNGVLPTGGQRWKCVDCGDHFTVGGKRGTYSERFKERIAQQYLHQQKTARELADETGLSTSTIVARGKAHKKTCAHCRG